MSRHRWIFALIGLALFASGCRKLPDKPEPLRLAAASDLRQALPILIAAFRQTREVEVDFSSASSGQLVEQIRQGAPFDLFLSANRGFADKLAGEGFVDASSVKPYAQGTLVLAINPIFDIRPKTLADLARPSIKSIAIANPDLAPYGIAARQTLKHLGLWDAVKSKLVPAESVHQALQFVRSGNAEVGFVSRALTDSPGLEYLKVPPESHEPIIQHLGVVTRSTRKDDARAFADFLTGPTGQAIFKDLGFAPAPASTPTTGPQPEAR